jgi:hypothetical protein
MGFDIGASPASDDSRHVEIKADPLNTISQGMDNLVVIDKKANYTDEAFWANLGIQVRTTTISTFLLYSFLLGGASLCADGLRQVGDEDESLDSDLESDDGEDLSAEAPLAAYCPSQSFISNNPMRHDLLPLHPTPPMMAYLWDAYVKNAEPILGLFHKPTTGKIILSAQNDPSTLSSGDEVLLFAIYFAGMRTLTAEDIQAKFGADKTYLLDQFRTGIERGLAKADYLKPRSITSLQALTLYLVSPPLLLRPPLPDFGN